MPPTLLPRWLPLLALLLFAALSLRLAGPPRPVPADAPATVFSAVRALREVDSLARAPHAIGTANHDRVRDHLLRRCRALGLRVRVQDTVVVTGTGGNLIGARVQNIVAVLPGRQSGGRAVLVLSHYDSQPHTPGAGDDGAGVAAALETVRALRAGPPLAHDVRWVFTDGEEVGLLGATAYAADTARLRREVGLVLNFEGRGNTGPSLLFELSAGNSWLLGEFAKAAPAPMGSSLAYEIYRYLPNSTDFTAFRAAGVPGLNFAFVGGYSYYHSPADMPAHLDLGSLQHHGDNMLPLVRHFAGLDLPPAPPATAPNSTFFNPLGAWLVRYPGAWNLALTLAGTALLLAAIARARQRGRLRLRGLLGGALASLVALALVLLTGAGLARLLDVAYPHYAVFYDHAFYNVEAYHLALAALGTAVVALWCGLLRRGLRPDSLRGGALVLVAAGQAFVQMKATTSGFLLGFPLLFGALGWLWSLRDAPRDGRRDAGGGGSPRRAVAPPLGLVGTLLALPAVALLAPNAAALLTVAGLGPLLAAGGLLLALLLVLLLPALLPALEGGPARTSGTGSAVRLGARPPTRWALPLLALAVALGALAAAHVRSQPTAEQPQQTHLYYALDASARPARAYWLTASDRPDAWNQQYLSAPTYAPLPALFPGSTEPLLHQSAPVQDLAPPTIVVLPADSTLTPLPTAGRRLRLLLRPGRPGVLSLRLSWPARAGLRQLRVAGQPLPAARLASASSAPPGAPNTSATSSLTFHAPGPAGVLLELELAGPEPLDLTVTDRSLGLPALPGLRPMSPARVPAPGYNSLTTQVRQQFRL